MQPGEKVLGVEGGGTKTAWVLVEWHGEELRVIEQGKLPPSNLRLTSPERLRAIFSEFPRKVNRAGVFLAGCVTDEDRQSLFRLCAATWPGAKIVTGSDRDSGMAAALGHGDGIVVNAGSGSSVTGRRGERLEKAGGCITPVCHALLCRGVRFAPHSSRFAPVVPNSQLTLLP